METKSTNQAAELMIDTGGIHLLEELAMCHLDEFAKRLESEYGRNVKRAGLEQVDYFGLALRFTVAFMDRHNAKMEELWEADPEGIKSQAA